MSSRVDLRASARQDGFSLIEVTLAIVVGLMVLTGVVVGYNYAKDSAAKTKARERVQGLQSIVEGWVSRNGVHPNTPDDLLNLQKTWKKRRTDWDTNPWGGGVGTDSQLQEYGLITQQANHQQFLSASYADDPALAGGLIYFGAPGTDEWFFLYDIEQGGVEVKVRAYGVAHLGGFGTFYHFVEGGENRN